LINQAIKAKNQKSQKLGFKLKFFVYCKELKNCFEIKDFKTKKGVKETLLLKDCTPYIPAHFLEDIPIYTLHPASLNLKDKKRIKIKIGFFCKKKELLFSLAVEEHFHILNPIIIKEEDFFGKPHSITIHNDGKRVLKHSFYPKRGKLDFYTLIDKIFFEFLQFDTIFDKKLVISFRKEER